MFKPNTLSAAFGLARLQEEEVGRRHTPICTTNNHYTPNPNYPKQTTLRLPSPNPLPKFPTPLTLPQPNLNPQRKYPLPIKRLSVSQMQERREKGLCYNCDEKYQFGHKCSRPSLYLLEGLELEASSYKVERDTEQYDQTPQTAELLVISLNAIAWVLSPKTMRLVGRIGKHSLIILIDTGSTHSFVDVNVARKLKLPVEDSHLAMQVADGAKFPCQGCCKAVLLKLQNCDVWVNLYLLTLGGCDVVLGVDWLRSLGTIQ